MKTLLNRGAMDAEEGVILLSWGGQGSLLKKIICAGICKPCVISMLKAEVLSYTHKQGSETLGNEWQGAWVGQMIGFLRVDVP